MRKFGVYAGYALVVIAALDWILSLFTSFYILPPVVIGGTDWSSYLCAGIGLLCVVVGKTGSKHDDIRSSLLPGLLYDGETVEFDRSAVMREKWYRGDATEGIIILTNIRLFFFAVSILEMKNLRKGNIDLSAFDTDDSNNIEVPLDRIKSVRTEPITLVVCDVDGNEYKFILGVFRKQVLSDIVEFINRRLTDSNESLEG